MTNLQHFHETIARELQEKTRLQKVLCYPGGRSLIEAPVGFLELSQIEMGNPPGTEELSLNLTWTLRILIDSALENAPIVLQSLLIETARVLYLNTFGLPITPVLSLQFHFELLQDTEAFLMGSLTWMQECHVGDSVWDSVEGIPPHTLHVDSTIISLKGGCHAG